MKFESVFTSLARSDIHADAQAKHDEGYRYVQMLAVNDHPVINLVYSYMLNGTLVNEVVEGLEPRSTVESISDIFLEAFVCENEIHDLFGISFDGLVIDFLGNFYHVSGETPMNVISPEQLEARKKAQAKAAQTDDAAPAKKTGDAEDIESKLAGMDPEKAAKVRAALEAKKKKKAPSSEDIESKLAGMDPEKAAKVRAALEAKAKKAAKTDGEA